MVKLASSLSGPFLAIFENDSREVTDARALMVIFNAQSWKTRKQIRKNNLR